MRKINWPCVLISYALDAEQCWRRVYRLWPLVEEKAGPNISIYSRSPLFT
jgi:hypothetical protein